MATLREQVTKTWLATVGSAQNLIRPVGSLFEVVAGVVASDPAVFKAERSRELLYRALTSAEPSASRAGCCRRCAPRARTRRAPGVADGSVPRRRRRRDVLRTVRARPPGRGECAYLRNRGGALALTVGARAQPRREVEVVARSRHRGRPSPHSSAARCHQPIVHTGCTTDRTSDVESGPRYLLSQLFGTRVLTTHISSVQRRTGPTRRVLARAPGWHP
jgi:hypothetical protein